MQQTWPERRCRLRIAADDELTVRVPAGDGSVLSEQAVLCDISADGLSFVTRHAEFYVPGQPVMLHMHHGESGDVTMFGRVAWMSDPDISTCGEMIQPRVGICVTRGNPLALQGIR